MRELSFYRIQCGKEVSAYQWSIGDEVGHYCRSGAELANDQAEKIWAGREKKIARAIPLPYHRNHDDGKGQDNAAEDEDDSPEQDD